MRVAGAGALRIYDDGMKYLVPNGDKEFSLTYGNETDGFLKITQSGTHLLDQLTITTKKKEIFHLFNPDPEKNISSAYNFLSAFKNNPTLHKKETFYFNANDFRGEKVRLGVCSEGFYLASNKNGFESLGSKITYEKMDEFASNAMKYAKKVGSDFYTKLSIAHQQNNVAPSTSAKSCDFTNIMEALQDAQDAVLSESKKGKINPKYLAEQSKQKVRICTIL